MEISWLVAAIAPWTIAPHPNFAVDDVRPPEALALVASHRGHDLLRYEDRTHYARPWERDLVQGALQSVTADEQQRGADQLRAVATRSGVPYGAKAAAALFLSVVHAELDAPEQSVEVLDNVLQALPNEDVAFPGSRRVLAAALLQQRAMRATEAGNVEQGSADARRTHDVLLEVEAREFERFRTSGSLSWDARQVQLDIVAALRLHALELEARLEALEGNLWAEVLRSRTGWLDARSDRLLVAGLQAFLQERFEQQLATARRGRRFRGTDPVELSMAAALLNAEFSGDLNEALRRREALGRLRLLRPGEAAAWALADSIRLLRQSDSREALAGALEWVRAEGPIEVLMRAAEQVLAKAATAARVMRSDLTVLRASAEVLDQSQRTNGLDAAWQYMQTDVREPSGVRMVVEAREELSWRTIARLAPGSGQEEVIASRVATRIIGGSIVAPGDRAIAAVVDALPWRHLDAASQGQLLEWAREHANGDLYDLATQIYDALLGPAATREELQRPQDGLALGARLLFEHAAGVPPKAAELDAAIRACVDRMQATRSSAAQGAYSFGGLDAADVAVALLSVFTLVELWEPVREYLADAALSQAQKSPSLERLARLSPSPPANVHSRLAEDWPSWTPDPTLTLLEEPSPFSVLPAAVRAGASLGVLPVERAIEALAEFTSVAAATGRLEAARTVPFVVQHMRPPDWAGFMLLQLSRDSDPIVRSEASFAIGQLRWEANRPLHRQLTQRLVELIDDQGLSMPLAVMQGLLLAPTGPLSLGIRDALERVRGEHRVARLRATADQVLTKHA